NLWWAEHTLGHLQNPFFTAYMAAPVGMHLAFSTLMPLAGWIMTPITVLYGPSASFGLLTIVTPGLLCYAMYRAARLWLNQPGAIVAGAFFGLASMLLWQNWYHVNIALGTIFLPITIEAAVRFRRNPRIPSAVVLGIALGASILINQESTIVALMLAIFILIPWLVGALVRNRELFRRAMKPLSFGALVGLVVALPQLIAMLQQIVAGGANPPIGQLTANYAQFGVSLPTLFAPSPRLANFGLGQLASSYSYYNAQQVLEGLPTFGAVLTAVALLGIAVGWRKRTTWAWVSLWLVSAALALGTSLTFGKNCVISAGIYHQPGKVYGQFCTQYLPLMNHLEATKVVYKGGPPGGVWKPVVVSDLMPYSWLVRVPGLSGLREADRFTLVGLIGAAMLAGLVVQFLSKRRSTWPLIGVIVVLGAFEAGWSGAPSSSPGFPSNFGYHGTMRSVLPDLDRPIARDHSKSIVVDVPFGLRGGVGITGQPISPSALVLATHDQHRRAISYNAWVSKLANKGIASHPFYRYLYVAEKAGHLYPSRIAAARKDLKTLNVGWVIEWRNVWTDHHQWARYKRLTKYLENVGFRQTEDFCLVGNHLNGAFCPRGQHVWLFKYMPGTPQDVLEP
ncbi:MAG: glycosyltransferase family 39 protein, partial [Nocardiopsaceae bacterium]|nr:glycosyltransferase family 39 protein [Nocardiopsaceae bacterium]